MMASSLIKNNELEAIIFYKQAKITEIIETVSTYHRKIESKNAYEAKTKSIDGFTNKFCIF